MQRIFIGGCHKSGTTLLTSLFDGHPDAWVFPYETHFWYSFYPEYLNPKYTQEERRERVLYIVTDLKRILKRWTGKVLDLDEFMNYFDKALQQFGEDLRGYFCAYVQAFKLVCSPKSQADILITKDTHSELHADIIFGLFPNTKFLNVVRDPRDNFASLFSGWEKHYKHQYSSKEKFFRDFIDRGLLCYQVALDNYKEYKNQYDIVRYDDLVYKPEQTMSRVSNFIGIDNTKLNLAPTMLGELWEGNSFQKSFKKVNKSRVGIYRNMLTSDQIKVIEYYFSAVMQSLKYSPDYSKSEQLKAMSKYYPIVNSMGEHYNKEYRRHE